MAPTEVIFPRASEIAHTAAAKLVVQVLKTPSPLAIKEASNTSIIEDIVNRGAKNRRPSAADDIKAGSWTKSNGIFAE